LLPNGWMDQDETWYGGWARPGPYGVRWGSSLPISYILAHVCCGQTAGWIKMPLDREVDLSPGDSVRSGSSSP